MGFPGLVAKRVSILCSILDRGIVIFNDVLNSILSCVDSVQALRLCCDFVMLMVVRIVCDDIFMI